MFQGALDFADERNSNSNSSTSVSTNNSGSSSGGRCGSPTDSGCSNNNQGALVFLHAGTYRGEFLVIDSDIALIGM